MLEKVEFYPLISDVVFKYLFKYTNTRKFFIKLIKHYTNIDLDGLEIIDNEVNIIKKKGARFDLLLKDNKNKIIYDIEVNGSNEKFFTDRNNRYVGLLIADLYDEYKGYKLVQININNYYCGKKRVTRSNHITLKDEENDIMMESLEHCNIYVAKICNKCYTDYDKELKLFRCRSYEEMEEVIESISNLKMKKESERIMLELRRQNNNMPLRYLLFTEEGQKRFYEDVKYYSREDGINQGKIESARNLLKENVDIDIIRKATGLSTETINSLR